MILSERSQKAMYGVHPDLGRVIYAAADRIDMTEGIGFIVTEGLRSPVRQKELFEAGATRTMNSRHLTGHAVDLAVTVWGDVRWDWPLYKKLADIVKAAASDLGVKITWGGDWRTFKDGPHFELDRKQYP
jgi:peptidoglycan L-alanyl-D-glutamate endopeptidase CwlK